MVDTQRIPVARRMTVVIEYPEHDAILTIDVALMQNGGRADV